jgi:hypothetical protein
VRQRPRVGQIVNRDKIDVGVADARAQNVAPDAPESVYPNFNAHLNKTPPEIF